VELLETGDVLDLRFPIHSSAELRRLTLLVEWAKACRLVRVGHRRIVPVRRNAKLLDRPLELAACDVAWSTAMSRYWFPDATEQQMEWERKAATATCGGCSTPSPTSVSSPSRTA
jgi:hypothetical protein